MIKALLVGNGMTAQLIENYSDKRMIEEYIKYDEENYRAINEMLEPFRKLKSKSESDILNLLDSMGMCQAHYNKYFLRQSLNEEIKSGNICAIESLLKVAHLFEDARKVDYERIKKIANQIYYNDGNNGFENIDSNLIDKKKFVSFINQFQEIYTTNYDNILDDTFKGEVKHLHGGFKFIRQNNNGAINIIKSEKNMNPEEAHLVWGTDEEEKLGNLRGGLTYPYRYPHNYGSSELKKYLTNLQYNEIDELHIWGYSGLNDAHINFAIMHNNNIKRIYYYGKPNQVEDSYYKSKIVKLFEIEDDQNKVCVLPWDDIWQALY